MAIATPPLRSASNSKNVRLLILNVVAVGVAALASVSALAASAKSPIRSPHGSTRGTVSSNPNWSLGAQLGSFGQTALIAQNAGFLEGALNLGLVQGLWRPLIFTDYVMFFRGGLKRIPLSSDDGYNTRRGLLTGYAGGGLQAGSGYALRVPGGVQYTMLRDPFDFFGGAVLLLGKYFADEDDSDLAIGVSFQVGARVLL